MKQQQLVSLTIKTSSYGRPIGDFGDFSSRKALLVHRLLWQLMWYSDTYKMFIHTYIRTSFMFNTKYV